jgi:hypothetical protein
MRRTFLILTLGFWSWILQGQNSLELLSLNGRWGAPTPLQAPATTGTGQESAVQLTLRAPIRINPKLIFYNLLNVNYYSVASSAPDTNGILNNPRLLGVIYQGGLIVRLSEVNALHFIAVPRYMREVGSVTPQAWQMGGVALFEHRFSDDLLLRFGAMYNQERSGALLVPLVDVNWQINARWSITGLFPIYGKINYRINPKMVTGISHFGLITTFALDEETYNGGYLERTAIDLAWFYRYNLTGNWHLESRLGYALGRTYAQFTADDRIDLRLSLAKFGDRRSEPINVLFNNGFFAELRLVYDLPLPKG